MSYKTLVDLLGIVVIGLRFMFFFFLRIRKLYWWVYDNASKVKLINGNREKKHSEKPIHLESSPHSLPKSNHKTIKKKRNFKRKIMRKKIVKADYFDDVKKSTKENV